MTKDLVKSLVLGFLTALWLFNLCWGEAQAKQEKYTSAFLIKKLEFQEINNWYYLYLRSCLDQATAAGADLIILEIDSPGGRVDTALKIANRLQTIEADLVVYINDNAISAGALISLVSEKIYISGGGVIGASTPVQIKEGEMKKAPEKMVSVMRSKFRSLAEKNERPVRVCEAMVDDDIVLTKTRDGYELEKGKLLTLTQKEAIALGVCDKRADSLNEVARDLGFNSIHDFAFYEITSRLKILNFLSNQAFLGILMTVGLLGLIFEARTPGWGVGGTLGILGLSVFFLIQVSLGNADWQVPALFLVGIILVGLELFIIPGFGIPGILGITSILGALFLSFGIDNWENGLAVVTTSLFSVLVISLLGLKYLPDMRAFRWLSLEKNIEARVTVDETQSIGVGMVGKVLGGLHPVGKAEIEGQVVEVMTRGEYVEAPKEVEVIKISGNQIFVKEH